MSLVDNLKSAVLSVGLPNREEEVHNTKAVHEHDAQAGAGMSDHEQPQTLYDQLHGDAGLQTMKAKGNIATGDSGLSKKATAHQEEMAERSRLRHEGLFEPHKTHQQLLDEHKDVARGSELSEHTGVGMTEEGDGRMV